MICIEKDKKRAPTRTEESEDPKKMYEGVELCRRQIYI